MTVAAPRERGKRRWLAVTVCLLGLVVVLFTAGRAWAAFTSSTDSTASLTAAPDFVTGSVYRWGSSTTPATTPVKIGSQQWQQISVGNINACGIRTDASLWCWGRSDEGQAGVGTVSGAVVLGQTQISPGVQWSRVATGNADTCAIRVDGTLWCWGANDLGQVGQGTSGGFYSTPVQVGTATCKQVAVRQTFTCAIRTDDTLWCFGWNYFGQLVQGTFDNAFTPIQVSPGSTFKSVDLGYATACAVRSDNTLWCWGANATGQAGVGDTSDRNTPTQVGAESTWASVSVDDAACGTRTDATLWCWGSNSNGQLGLGDSTNRPSPVAVTTPAAGGWANVAATSSNACAVRSDGSLWCWGSNDNSRSALGTSTAQVSVPTRVGTDTTWSSVSGYNQFGCGIRTDSSLWCWGNNSSGQLGASIATPEALIATARQWRSVSAGRSHVCAIRSDATLWCSDTNSSRQLGLGGTTPGAVLAQVGTAQWLSVDAGTAQTCAVRSDNQLWCWGEQGSGRLGNGATGGTTDPVLIDSGQGYLRVSTGDASTCGIRTDKTLWCWGANGSGQLGIGSTTDASTPTQVGTAVWSTVSVGTAHACGVRVDQSLWCWGANGAGQLGVGDTTARTTPTAVDSSRSYASVAAGDQHACAIRQSGVLMCWGSDAYGQLGDGGSASATSPVRENTANSTWYAVDVGFGHTCAARANRTVWCWGLNSAGQLAGNTRTNSAVPVQIAAFTTSRTFATGWFGTYAIQW